MPELIDPERSIRSPAGWVFSDEKMLRQVLLNFLGTAIEFTPQEGSVAVAETRTYRGEARGVVPLTPGAAQRRHKVSRR